MPIFLVFATVKSSEGYRILKKKKKKRDMPVEIKKKEKANNTIRFGGEQVGTEFPFRRR
jgi:hypothetical protein